MYDKHLAYNPSLVGIFVSSTYLAISTSCQLVVFWYKYAKMLGPHAYVAC